MSRLTSLTVNLSGTASDLTKTFAYNPASQIVSETRSNDAYAQVLANATQTTVTNGLNQLSTVNGTAAAYDARGNMTTDPVTAKTQSYWPSNNQLWNVPSPFTSFNYDALDRLASMSTGSPVTNYVSDGSNIIAEYDGSNVLQKRYAFDGSGSPLVAYDAAGNRTWMLADERGSVVALANDSGAMTAIDTYDEYGIPSTANQGTFQYAGMLWLAGPGLYAPTFRAFNANQGRFNQTDPMGMAGGVNLYTYVAGDPINFIDPLGLAGCGPATSGPGGEIIVTACSNFGMAGLLAGIASVAAGAAEATADAADQANQDKKQSRSQCVLQALDKNKEALALDAVGGIASLTGLKTAWTAGSFAAGATTTLLSVIVAGSTGGNQSQALVLGGAAIGIGAPLTTAAGVIGVSKVIGSSLPTVGALVSGGILAKDTYDALKKAGCL